MEFNVKSQVSLWLIRVCDILLSLTAIACFVPCFIILAIILKLTGEGRVLYLQERVGYAGEVFYLLKFTTMIQNSPNIGSKELTLPDDPRVLPIGKILRKTKFNELPQLFNVLKGDLSLIGPRPQTKYYFNCFYKDDIKFITSMRPGLSGIGSVFFRNEEELFRDHSDAKMFDEKIIMPYKGQLERWYADNLSIRNYFILIFLSIYVVVTNGKIDLFKIFQNLPIPPRELKRTKL